MTDQRDELIESLGMGISRRTMLKGMGYGLAGAAIAPSLLTAVYGQRKLGASLSGYAAQTVWDYTPDPSLKYISGDPVFYNGTIIVPSYTEKGSTLYGLDLQTK